MQVRSIENKDAATVDTCESEPIHIPGSIQPHGFLLAVDPVSLTILFCSANVGNFIGLLPQQILNHPLSLLDPSKEGLLNLIMQADEQQHPVLFSFAENKFDVIARRSKELVILEFELHLSASENNYQLFDQTSQFVSNIEKARSLKELCQNIAAEIRNLTGYDRVMIYKFDKDYNGEVYAESKHEDLKPFLELHYPHTDIPVQARELYLRNLLRLIVDVHYEPVPIVTTTSVSHQALDLSDVKLRSVSPIHIQYLKNMGVGATLTISLLQDGRLWGLIACHHNSPKNLSYAQRQAALLQGHFLSSQIKVRQVAEEHEINIVVEAHLQQLLNTVNVEEDFSEKFEQFNSLLGLTNASGAVILHNGRLFERGLVPPKEKTLELIHWINKNVKSVQFSTSFLHSRYPDAMAISRYASGIFYHALGKPTENCVIWFREEIEKTINWAGNPQEAVQREEGTKSLTPRKSFATWKEKVRYHSREWRVSERNAAIRFSTALQNYFHLVYLRNEDFKLRILNEKLQKANQELSNINWISSHDLKEPLRKIQVFASRVMEQEGEEISDLIRGSIERIQKSAGRMQQMVDDILSYSLTGNTDQSFAITDLNAIIGEVITKLKENLADKKAVLDIHMLPQAVRAVPYQMQQLFLHLLSNAIKFTQTERSPHIQITCKRLRGSEITEVTFPSDQHYYCIGVQDNGIGFGSANSQRIFDIFYRLHDKESYEGTGIGLAICKKIMDNHQGAIIAEGEEGNGARFFIYLPV